MTSVMFLQLLQLVGVNNVAYDVRERRFRWSLRGFIFSVLHALNFLVCLLTYETEYTVFGFSNNDKSGFLSMVYASLTAICHTLLMLVIFVSAMVQWSDYSRLANQLAMAESEMAELDRQKVDNSIYNRVQFVHVGVHLLCFARHLQMAVSFFEQGNSEYAAFFIWFAVRIYCFAVIMYFIHFMYKLKVQFDRICQIVN
jgi:hypothetical protein